MKVVQVATNSARRGLLFTLVGITRPWQRSTARAYSVTPSTTSSLLSDPSLIESNHESKESFPVYNPAEPDSVVGYAPLMNGAHAKEAIKRSHRALAGWRDDTTAQYRADLLIKWSQLIQDNAEDLAIIMTLESGKPLKESRGEVAYGRSFLDFFAAEAVRQTGSGGGMLIPTPFATSEGRPRGNVMAIQQAIGVVCAISPWNFPIAMLSRKLAPALATGCTAVLKPAELTPLTAIAVQNLAYQAGIPSDVLQLITANKDSTPEVGTEFCINPLVRKISFTGSTAVGKLLIKQSSDTVKRLSLELGGNAPFVVFEDADIDQAVASAMASKFRNAGQTCVCADRFLVHASIHDEFVEKLTKQINQLKVGPGIEPSTTMGPLIALEAVEKTRKNVENAINEGAQCVVGGSPIPELGPQFFQPTILTDVSPDSDIFKLESFAPVVAIVKFDSEEEALRIANDADVGLSSYFCTKDLNRAFRFSQNLEAGIVALNDGIISTCKAPFGGVKESGMGREGSSMGLAEYTETKYIFMNV